MPDKKRPITVDDLWKLERIGAVDLSPDGAQAVVSVSSPSMEDNRVRSALWLLSTLGGEPRLLTTGGDKDGQPAWSPRGDLIAFVGKREQEGHHDDEPQLYVIAPDGGEARRLTRLPTGVEAFKWFPDGRRIAFVSWVWPEARGLAAQARLHKALKERKETGYVTDEAQYRFWDRMLPMGREPHLMVVEVDARGRAGRVRDLFEGMPYALTRADPDAHAFDIAPDGRCIVFAHDPSPRKQLDNCFALAELDLRRGQVRTLVQDAAWDCNAPVYSPTGDRVAFLASHQGLKHTMPAQLAVVDLARGDWTVESAQWDHAVDAPLHWEDDGQALLFTAEQRGRRPLWRFDLPDRRAEVVVPGGWVHGWDKAAGVVVTVSDSHLHPARVHAHLPGEPPCRIERFNDATLNRLRFGRVEELWFEGASGAAGTAPQARPGDEVQMWVVYPPDFDPKRKYPMLHVIHGGPHTAAGDTWHYRWNLPVFAARGYVVCALNYHGSSSFGYTFLDSISHRWGELELRDLEAATDTMLARPFIDPQRVYASGGSYGGYLVAWMNGHVPPGRYAAYVCHAGCFDWTAMFADDAYTWHVKELGGWYWQAPERVAAQSPHASAGAMATPTLVVHGALDYRVPDQQGLAYYNTLKALNVDARLLWFPDENHWVLKPRNSKLWYDEFFGWLQRHEPKARPKAVRKRAPKAGS